MFWVLVSYSFAVLCFSRFSMIPGTADTRRIYRGRREPTWCRSPMDEQQLFATKLVMRIILVCFFRDGVGHRCTLALIRHFLCCSKHFR